MPRAKRFPALKVKTTKDARARMEFDTSASIKYQERDMQEAAAKKLNRITKEKK